MAEPTTTQDPTPQPAATPPVEPPAAAASPPPAAPPAEPQAAPPEAPAKPKDPWVESLAKSFGMVIDPVAETASTPPKPEEPPKVEPQAQTPPAPTPEPEKPAEPPKRATAEGIMAKLVEQDPEPSQEQKPATPAPPAPPAVPEDEYDKSLTGAAKEEIEFARYAEEKGMRGKLAETRAFLKKLDEFTAKNPNLGTESDEFKEFLAENKPRYQEGERRRMEMAKIREDVARETEDRILKNVESRTSEINKKLRELEVKPQAEAEVRGFVDSLVANKPALPQGVNAIDPSVTRRIEEVGFEEAAKEFPIEAPIVYSTIVAAKEFVAVSKGIKQVDPKNPTHSWLGKFVEEQERIFETSSSDTDKVIGGKRFVPRWKRAELMKTNPAEASKTWSFSDKEVLDMLATNAHIAAKAEEDRLARAGFERKRANAAPAAPQSTVVVTPQAQDTSNGSGSPKAGASRSLGAAAPRPKAATSEAAYLDLLMPGASQMIGLG